MRASFDTQSWLITLLTSLLPHNSSYMIISQMGLILFFILFSFKGVNYIKFSSNYLSSNEMWLQLSPSDHCQIAVNNKHALIIDQECITVYDSIWRRQLIPLHLPQAQLAVSSQCLSYLIAQDNISDDLLILLPTKGLVTSLQIKSVNEFYRIFLLHAGYYEDLPSRAPPLS